MAVMLFSFVLILIMSFIKESFPEVSKSLYYIVFINFILLSFSILGSLLNFSLIVRRLKDINYSPVLVALILIPYINLIFMLFLCIKKGLGILSEESRYTLNKKRNIFKTLINV